VRIEALERNMEVRRWYRSKYLFLLLFTVMTLAGIATWKLYTVKADKPIYLFASVDRGNIVTQVAANGTLAAVTTVLVGTQVSGTILELYADFNSEVKKGQLLAKLDPDLFRTQVEQAQAGVQTAEATLTDDAAAIANTKANLERAKVDVLDRTRKLSRIKQLMVDGLVTQDDLETAQAALGAAVATQNASQAQIESADAHYKADQARLIQVRAALKTAQVNLEHTIITSPISGTIISRSIDRGQTVAASFSSPTLFTIGEDLTKMQVNTNIDEADVGKLKLEMEASFTVDAYPGDNFRGKVSQIRLAATTVQNVVTYNAIIDVPNEQLKLKPGMTANVRILIQKAENALRLPSAALRFRPTMSDIEMSEAFKRAGEEKFWALSENVPGTGGQTQSGSASGAAPPRAGVASDSGAGNRGGGSGATARDPATASRSNRVRRQSIWIMAEDKLLRPVVVRLGLTDGSQTEVVEGKLKEGDRIVVGVELDPNQTVPAPSTRAPGFGGTPTGGRGMR
jgi:HlyD family secretion protein